MNIDNLIAEVKALEAKIAALQQEHSERLAVAEEALEEFSASLERLRGIR